MNLKIWLMNHHARDYGRHPSLAKYLAEDGSDVTLFSASFLHNTFEETKRYKKTEYYLEEKIDDYERVYIKTPSYQNNGIKRLKNQLVFALRSYKAGKKKIETETTPEVIMGSSVHLFTGLSAYFLSKKSNAKFLFEIRDVWPQTLIDLGAIRKNSIVTKFFERIEKFLYKKADLIVSVLPNAEDHITKYNIDKNKIVYLPNGIDINNFNQALQSKFTAIEASEYFAENKNSFIVSYTGAHGVANGLDTLLKTAKLFEKDSNVKFLLVGDGPEKNKLLKQASELNLTNVTFLERVEKTQVAHILDKSDVCLFHLNKTPVFKYGISSNKLFDYMISGKPMIFAVETSFDFSLESKNGISIEPENPNEMKKAISKLQSMTQEELKLMGENGIKFVEEHHDIQKISLKLKKYIKNRCI